MKKLWKNGLNLRDNVRRRLPEMADEFFEDGRVALVPGASWDEMHQFRLRAKRFRYTLEIFRPAYGRGLEIRIDAVKKVQTYLGDINDCIVTADLIKMSPDAEVHRAKLDSRAHKLTEKLRRFWNEQFDAPGEQGKWSFYLNRYACPERRAPSTEKQSG